MNTALFLFWAFKIFSQQLFILSILCIISVLRTWKYRGREDTESLLSSDLYLSKKTKYEYKNTMTSIKAIYFLKVSVLNPRELILNLKNYMAP